jgi:HAD superfamily hydrolase (TIGR01549 family)
MEAHAGALDLIKKLLARCRVGIVTASTQSLVLEDLQRLNFPIDDFFAIQTAEDTSFHKPDPRVFDPILTKLKAEAIEKEDVLYIGDGIRDYQAAKDAGISFLGITHGTTTKDEFAKCGTVAFDSFIEIATFLTD